MKKSINLFKKSVKNIYQNKYLYLLNMSLIQLFIILTGQFLIGNIFKTILMVSGVHNLNNSNLPMILSNPLSLLLIVLIVLVMAFFIFIEYSYLTMLIYSNISKRDFLFKNVIKEAFIKAKDLRGRNFIFFIIYFISIIPLENLGISSVLLEEIYIPNFIVGEVLKSSIGVILYYSFIMIILFFNLRFIYVLALNTSNNKSFSYNLKKSWELTKADKSPLLSMILLQLLISLVFFIIIFTILFGFGLLDDSGNNLLIQSISFAFVSFFVFFYKIISKVGIVTVLVCNLVDNKIINKEMIKDRKKIPSKILLAVLSGLFILVLTMRVDQVKNATYNNKTKVIAHRGSIVHGVENSIEALEGAAKQGADYVEIDVILSKDEKFVVSHDNNLKRLAGINKNIRDMNLDEVIDIEISQDDFKSKIPSLDDFIKRAKELNVKLLVELKPYGGEGENYPNLLIDKLKEHGVLYDYKLMSLNLELMKKINKIDSKIDTGYVIPILFGKIGNEDIDFYVIEDFSFNNDILIEAKKNNKEVYVWTINQESRMDHYIDINPDGIITDFLQKFKDRKTYMEENNSYFDRFLRILFKKN